MVRTHLSMLETGQRRVTPGLMTWEERLGDVTGLDGMLDSIMAVCVMNRKHLCEGSVKHGSALAAQFVAHSGNTWIDIHTIRLT